MRTDPGDASVGPRPDDPPAPTWAALRDDPLRRDLLDALIADRRAARDLAAAALTAEPAAPTQHPEHLAELAAPLAESASPALHLALEHPERLAARAAAIGGLVEAALALEHLARLAAVAPRPLALELRVALGALAPDDALPRLPLATAEGLEVFARLAPACGRDALLAGLLRVPWDGYRPVCSRDLCPALRRAVALGLGAQLVERLAGDDLLAALLPDLDGDLRRAALAHLHAQLAGRDDPLDVLALVLAARPHLRPDELEDLRAARPDLPARLDPPDLRAWIAPHLEATWARAGADLDALERCADALGPLLTPAESLRWQEQVLAAALRGDDVLHRLQTGVLDLELATLTLAERLSPPRACEALAWIAWGQGEVAARRALDAWIALADPSPAAADLLALLLPRLDAPGRALAAAHLLASPGRTRAHELQALCHLVDAPHHRARARELARDATLGDVPLAFPAARAVPFLARLAAALPGDARRPVLDLALRHLDPAPGPCRAAGLAALAPLLDPPVRDDLVHGTLAARDLSPADAARLLAALPEDQVEAALAEPLRRALALPALWDRWDALRELAAALPDARAGAWLRAVFRRRAGEAEPDELLALPRRALDLELRRARIARELADPGPYTGWLLGDLARGLPEGERGPVLDAALAAFDRIALTPTSPGNDAGPFVALADLLDADQARRALAITARMAAAPWGSDLEVARQALLLRLAELGEPDAEAELLALDPAASAWARGRLLALRLRRGEPPAAALSPLAALPEDDPEARYETLTTALRELDDHVPGAMSSHPAAALVGPGDHGPGAMSPHPAAALVEPLLALPDAELRARGLAELLAARPDLLTPAQQHALIAAHARGDACLELRLDLALRASDPTLRARLVREVMGLLDAGADLDRALAPLCRLGATVPADDLARSLATWLAADRPPGVSLLGELCDGELAELLPAALLRLGGPTALHAAAAAIDRLARDLA